MARRASSAPACAVARRDIRRRRAAAPAPPHAKRTKRARIRAARGAPRPGRPTGRGPAATAEQQRACVARLASPTPEHSRRATRSRFSSKRKGMVGARRRPADQLSPRQNRLQHARRVFSRALPRRRAGRARRQPPTLPSLPLSDACVGAPPTPRSRRASDPSALPAPRAPRRATLHGAVPMPARRHNSHAGQRAIPALPPLSGECRGRGATTRSAVTRQAGWVVVVERGSERRRGRPTGPARARRARAAPPLPRDSARARVHRCGWAW